MASKPPKIINIDIKNHFVCLETQTHPFGPQKPYFFENFQFSVFLDVLQKSRFLGGHRGVFGFQTLHKVLKYMGDDGFIIFWTQIGHFQGEHRGGFESPPHQETYSFNPTWNRVKMPLLALFGVKMSKIDIQSPKLIVPNDYQQF